MTLVVYEHDLITAEGTGSHPNRVPAHVFDWLEFQAYVEGDGSCQWLKPARRNGARAVRVTSYAGVVRSPDGFQIEILPKTGRNTLDAEARDLFVRMLACLPEFRSIRFQDASLRTHQAPLLDIFIIHFLASVDRLIRHGLRGGYSTERDELRALRGKLLVGRHVRLNSIRRERFSVEYDEFRLDRPVNRLVRTALSRVGRLTSSGELHRTARRLLMPFDGIPESLHVAQDFQSARIGRDMQRYEEPLAWSRLILQHLSPLMASGDHSAPSMLYPMEALFEAYVAKCLERKLPSGYRLQRQATSKYLATHNEANWFQLRPDMLLHGPEGLVAVLDTKWKLLDSSKSSRGEKYNMKEGDIYQMYAYGHRYLGGAGELTLIYPKTDSFQVPVPPFEFPGHSNLRLSVLPFCTRAGELIAECATLGIPGLNLGLKA